jgi:hypothetical protein
MIVITATNMGSFDRTELSRTLTHALREIGAIANNESAELAPTPKDKLERDVFLENHIGDFGICAGDAALAPAAFASKRIDFFIGMSKAAVKHAVIFRRDSDGNIISRNYERPKLKVGRPLKNAYA